MGAFKLQIFQKQGPPFQLISMDTKTFSIWCINWTPICNKISGSDPCQDANCKAYETCENEVTSYQCGCPSGYTGSLCTSKSFLYYFCTYLIINCDNIFAKLTREEKTKTYVIHRRKKRRIIYYQHCILPEYRNKMPHCSIEIDEALMKFFISMIKIIIWCLIKYTLTIFLLNF